MMLVSRFAARAAISCPMQHVTRRTLISMKDVMYTATATASGQGRQGIVKSGALSFKLAQPKELGGPGGQGTNPEQLAAMGFSSCWLSALNLVARQKKIKLPVDVAVHVSVSIGSSKEREGFALSVGIEVSGLKNKDFDADQLVAEAHEVCPYSRAFVHGATVTAKAI